MTLEHPPVRRRKDIGAPTPLLLEADLARRVSRRRLEILLVLFLALCALEGLIAAAASGIWLLMPAVTGLGVLYFFVARELGDVWLRRALRASEHASTRLARLVASEAKTAGVQEPEVLLAAGTEPNAIALSLRKRSVIVTRACEELDELALEGLLSHEVIHIRDGDAAVASLYLVLAAAPELLFKGAGLASALGIPLWPVSLGMRLVRVVAIPADREHRADIAAAMLTRYPPGIVAALGVAGGQSCGLRAADRLWFLSRDATRRDAQMRAGLVSEM
jgi:Zn-dependent protease with chaperone function